MEFLVEFYSRVNKKRLRDERRNKSLFLTSNLWSTPMPIQCVYEIIAKRKVDISLSINVGCLKEFLVFWKCHEKYIIQSLAFNDVDKLYDCCAQSSTILSAYQFNLNGLTIDVGDITLYVLHRLKLHIEWFQPSIEMKLKSNEDHFLKLMEYFCLGRPLRKYADIVGSKWAHELFDELAATVDCDDIDHSFIMNISKNSRERFLRCLSLYMETALLKESERVRTFSFGWPHKSDIINIEELAQAGFYYTYDHDQVACVFCDILLHTWESNDIPIIEHYKYSPRCLMLTNLKCTKNVSDIRGEKQLDNILSALPVRGYDEVDSI